MKVLEIIGLIYLIGMNVLLFVLMGVDKSRARRQAWRIPEATLFLVALLGGSLGGVLGMRHFRHKTLHTTFRLGFPAILVCQVFILGYFILR